MPDYRNDDERAAWATAENLVQKARAMLLEAEKAMEQWRTGKEMNKQRCARKGISASDAEIRWSASSVAKAAISGNTFHVGLATMYYTAANAHYARALYLRERD
ncbi:MULTISPECIES: hypothetical protein [Actinoplanes]|uniref:hypothetical protein n=1 Tax=Actinoplanes TaxID=1865 RepID=UPI0005F2BB45|nr:MULTISPECIES: hypothetical protein [Actinoplanes]GLY01106.1 hypothetical protein Acsp01_14850 [Actinoplanes sp. NBRC 101535]